MSIVVDTSVWINVLNANWTAGARMFRAIVQHDEVLVGDLVLCEVLQGLRDDGEARRVERAMGQFAAVNLSTPTLAVAAAAHYRRLCGIGVTVRSTIDLLIATFCLDGGHALLHDDRDFERMERHLGLRIVRVN